LREGLFRSRLFDGRILSHPWGGVNIFKKIFKKYQSMKESGRIPAWVLNNAREWEWVIRDIRL
jgi:hypothetical protein